MEKKRHSTTTSTFGMPGRENHDSTPFYAGRLYQDQPRESINDFPENPVAIEMPGPHFLLFFRKYV